MSATCFFCNRGCPPATGVCVACDERLDYVGMLRTRPEQPPSESPLMGLHYHADGRRFKKRRAVSVE